MLRILGRQSSRACAVALPASSAVCQRAAFSSSCISQIRFIAPIDRTTVPAPTAEVPDVQTFLTKIGRNMTEYADQFETWESLMTMSSYELKNKGIDTRPRRYLLQWREKFRRGEPLTEHVRGKKRWGGERKRTEVRAKHFGRLKAEERQ